MTLMEAFAGKQIRFKRDFMMKEEDWNFELDKINQRGKENIDSSVARWLKLEIIPT